MTDRELIIIQNMMLISIFDNERLKAKTKDRVCEVLKIVSQHLKLGAVK